MTERAKFIVVVIVIGIASLAFLSYTLSNSLVIERSGSQYTYRSTFNTAWLGIPVVLIAFAAAFFLIRHRRINWMPALLFLGIAGWFSFAMFSMDVSNHKVVVDQTSVVSEWGTVNKPERVEIDLSSTSELSLIKMERNGLTEDLLIAKDNSGKTITVPVNDLVRAALKRILVTASANNVRIQIDPDPNNEVGK
jgi:heme/copper-type cytochrome/quinol oxidase subunit 2